MPEQSAPKRQIIGFVCERALPLERMLDEHKALLEDPDTRIVVVPCSGFVKPTQMGLALAWKFDWFLIAN